MQLPFTKVQHSIQRGLCVFRTPINPQLTPEGFCVSFSLTVKEKFINGGVFKMFDGPQERLLFNFEQSCLAAGIPQILGKLVAQSLVHGCGGFPHFAPSHFYYISTSDLQKPSAYASVYDVYDSEKREILEKVQNRLLHLLLRAAKIFNIEHHYSYC